MSNILPISDGSNTPADFRESIMKLQAEMLAMPGQMQLETRHYFAPGLYMREVIMPKDTYIIGGVPKTEFLNIISKGAMSMSTEAGMTRIDAPAILRSKPGLKRAIYTHEDTVYVSVHENPTNETDIDKLEEMLFALSYDCLPPVTDTTDEPPVITFKGKRDNYVETYLSSKRTFDDALKALNITPGAMRIASEKKDDIVPFPVQPEGIALADSAIHGKGLFAIKTFQIGEVIAASKIGGWRTYVDRYVNHSGQPNSEMRLRHDGDVDLVAIKEINPGEEFLSDYFSNFINTRTNSLTKISGENKL